MTWRRLNSWSKRYGACDDGYLAEYVMRTGQSDPAPIPTEWVFAIKLAGGLVFLVALVLTLSHRDTAPAQ